MNLWEHNSNEEAQPFAGKEKIWKDDHSANNNNYNAIDSNTQRRDLEDGNNQPKGTRIKCTFENFWQFCRKLSEQKIMTHVL